MEAVKGEMGRNIEENVPDVFVFVFRARVYGLEPRNKTNTAVLFLNSFQKQTFGYDFGPEKVWV